MSVREAKLNLVTTVIQQLRPLPTTKRSRLEIELYESALRGAVKALMNPEDAKKAISEHEAELAADRARAEAARRARELRTQPVIEVKQTMVERFPGPGGAQ